jgi:hypothetical protein
MHSASKERRETELALLLTGTLSALPRSLSLGAASNLLATQPVISAFSFASSSFLSTYPELCSLCRIEGNLLESRPVIFPCSLISNSTLAFCSACYFSCACSSPSWDSQRLSRSLFPLSLSLPLRLVLSPPETVSPPFPFLSLFRLIY